MTRNVFPVGGVQPNVPSPHEDNQWGYSKRRYVSTQTGNQVVIPREHQNSPVRLLDCDIKEVDPFRIWEGGAWIVTVTTDVSLETGVEQVNPLIARVGFGDGAITNIIELDIAAGAIFQASCGVLQVDAVLQTPPDGFDAPLSQKITASTHRGSFSTKSNTRSFYRVLAAAGVVTGVVPSTAVGVQVYGGPIDGTLRLFGGNATAVTELAEYSTAQLLAGQNAAQHPLVPKRALTWSYTAGGAGGLVAVEFLLGL